MVPLMAVDCVTWACAAKQAPMENSGSDEFLNIVFHNLCDGLPF
jgi:hypothetical protein